MTVTGIVATYVVVWWLVFFTVLPIGGRSPQKAGELTLGTDHGAPANPMLWRKAGITTIVAAIFFALGYGVFAFFEIGIDDLMI